MDRIKKMVPLMIIAVLIMSCGGGGGGGGGGTSGNSLPSNENLLTVKNITSSNNNNIEILKCLVDNDLSTQWGTDWNDSSSYSPDYVVFDYGESVTVKQVAIYWLFDYAVKYKLQVSSDGSINSWKDVYTKTDSEGGVDNIVIPSPAQGRYLRLYMTDKVFPGNFSITEFQSYSTAGNSVLSGPTDGNLIWNGDFSKGLWKWHFHADESYGASASFAVDNGIANIKVNAIADEDYRIQFEQLPVHIMSGKKYVLTFDAWSDTESYITVFVSEGNADVNGNSIKYDRYLDMGRSKLGTTRKTYTYTIPIWDTDRNAILQFNLGLVKTNYHISNVSLRETTQIPAAPALGTELVPNGTFNDLTSWSNYSYGDFKGYIDVDNGSLMIRLYAGISTNPPSSSALQACSSYPGAFLQSGHKYRFKYDAWANNAISAVFGVDRNNQKINTAGDRYSCYVSSTSKLSNGGMNSYFCYFTPEETNKNARITINMLGSAGDIAYIDNLSVVEVQSFPWDSWSSSAAPAGGSDISTATSLSVLKKYTYTATGSNTPVYYKIPITSGKSYLLQTFGNMGMSVLNSSGEQYLDTLVGFGSWTDEGITTQYKPLVVTPTENVIYLLVVDHNSGSFGVQEM